METVILWVTIFGILVIPVAGWVFKIAVEKNLTALAKQQDLDRDLFFKKYDEVKEIYVRKDIYQQASEFHQKETDTKFQNLIVLMNSQFKTVEDKIEDLKVLIIKNFNNPRNSTNE